MHMTSTRASYNGNVSAKEPPDDRFKVSCDVQGFGAQFATET
jgi:hypothetical protein